MSINAQIKVSEYDQEGKSIPFDISNGYTTLKPDVFLLWVNNVQSSGIAIYASGFRLSTTAPAGKVLRMDWYLYPSGDCIIDDDPIFQGTTWYTVGSTRNGRLVQVTDVDARAWFLRVVIEDPGVPFKLTGAMEYKCFREMAANAPQIAVGPFIG